MGGAFAQGPPGLGRLAASLALSSLVLAFGCGGHAAQAIAPCDQACQDGVALRALRVQMRFVFNFGVAAKPVGPQDALVPCIPLGDVRVKGTAETDPKLGISRVDLVYVFTDCQASSPSSAAPERNYSLTMNGSVGELGALAMGGGLTSLVFTGQKIRVRGVVYDPPVGYPPGDEECDLAAAQDGNNVTGTLCGRTVKGFSGF